jgi:hypothetical protein
MSLSPPKMLLSMKLSNQSLLLISCFFHSHCISFPLQAPWNNRPYKSEWHS